MWKKCYFLLLLFLKIVSHWQEDLFQKPIRLFLGCYSVPLFQCSISTDVDTIENHVHPLYIIVDRNQEFIISLKTFCIKEQNIS